MKKVILSLLVASSMFAFGCSSSEGGGNTIQATPERPIINVPFKVSSLVTTGRTTFAIATDGKLYTWGDNDYGQVGNGRSGSNEYQRTPYEVTGIVGKVKSLETDGSTVYAITEDNRLYAWGSNTYGQVGNGSTGGTQTTPYEVTLVGKVKSLEVYDDYYSSSYLLTVYAITEEGKLYAWGNNEYGQVGNGSTGTQTIPYELTSVGKVKSIEISRSAVYAITEEGKLYAWGNNEYGQVGNGRSGSFEKQITPYELTSVGKVKSIEISGSTVYAITEDGKLYAWGINYSGQVGNGSTSYQTTPYELTSVGKVKSLERNGSTVYVITEEGKLYAWGDNGWGVVGNGSTTNQKTPYEVTSIVGKVKSLKVGVKVYNINYLYTVYAITEDGRLYAWGNNFYGEVGNGSTSYQTTPYELTSVGKVKSVIGGSTVYAITEDGKLYAWGLNEYGEVGNGSTSNQTIPYELTSIVGKVKSVISGSTVYAITEDNKLYAWGDNRYGQVGNGSTSNQTTPYYISEVKQFLE